MLADDDGAVLADIDSDLTRRPGGRLSDDLDAVLLVFVGHLYTLERLHGAQQCDDAARQDALVDGRAGRMHGVIDPILTRLPIDR